MKDQSTNLAAGGPGLRALAAAVLPGWLLALLLSALIRAAGRRWPASLPVQPLLALVLVLLPPLALLLWLLLERRHPGRGESAD